MDDSRRWPFGHNWVTLFSYLALFEISNSPGTINRSLSRSTFAVRYRRPKVNVCICWRVKSWCVGCKSALKIAQNCMITRCFFCYTLFTPRAEVWLLVVWIILIHKGISLRGYSEVDREKSLINCSKSLNNSVPSVYAFAKCSEISTQKAAFLEFIVCLHLNNN